MLLQAEASAGFDLDALDLEADAFVDAVVPAPGAVDFSMKGVFFAFRGLQLGDDVLHVLAASPVGHEHGIWRFDDDEVLNADQAH